MHLDHLNYAKDSVKDGNAKQRAKEAIAHPERFQLLCYSCHMGKTAATLSANGGYADPSIGMERRVLEGRRIRRERKLESNVVQDEKEVEKVLEGEKGKPADEPSVPEEPEAPEAEVDYESVIEDLQRQLNDRDRRVEELAEKLVLANRTIERGNDQLLAWFGSYTPNGKLKLKFDGGTNYHLEGVSA